MDIPDDIMRAAGDAILKAGHAYFVGGDIHTAIAEALLAERQRCAKIADEIKQPGVPGTDRWLALGNFAGQIAAAIRTPSTGEEQ